MFTLAVGESFAKKSAKGDAMSKSGLLARQKAELKEACGKYYAPREVRYDIKIVTRDGKQHKL